MNYITWVGVTILATASFWIAGVIIANVVLLIDKKFQNWREK